MTGEDVVRVAVVQAAPVLFDREETVDKMAALAAQAAGQGARLVLFPEAFVSAYPRGMDFGAVVGNRSDEGREQFRRYFESAVAVPSSTTERMGEIAAKHGIYLVCGVIERGGATLYCSVVFFGPDGSYLGKHRKLMPTGSERLVWGQGDGSTLPVFDTPIGQLGAVICWENYMPLLRTAMYAQGIEIYCAPTADCRDTWTATLQHIACEGRCFVLGCNQWMTGAAYPGDLRPAGVQEEDVVCQGGSAIVDPFGRLLAGPAFEGEAVLIADLDRKALVRAKYDFDVVGHYSRPDVFRLQVDTRPKPGVAFGAKSPVGDMDTDS